jgi:hypothetical protein
MEIFGTGILMLYPGGLAGMELFRPPDGANRLL